MTLGAQMIDLLRLKVIDEVGHLAGIAEIAVVEKKPSFGNMGVRINMVDATRVKSARAPNQAMDLIAFGEEEFRQIGTILPGDPGNESFHESLRGLVKGEVEAKIEMRTQT
jgi:hypothetical protein